VAVLMILALVALPLLAVAGIARPHVRISGGGGEWNQETGRGTLTVNVENRGWVPARVSKAISTAGDMALAGPVTIRAGDTGEVRITYIIPCGSSQTPPTVQLEVDAPGPASLLADATDVTDTLLPYGICPP
jgi:hypothetical protein